MSATSPQFKKTYGHKASDKQCNKCTKPAPCECPKSECDGWMRKYLCRKPKTHDFYDSMTFAARYSLRKTDDPSNPMAAITLDDTNFCALRSIFGYDQGAVDRHVASAVVFFKERFGLDFSNSDFVDGRWSVGSATLIPYYVPYAFGNHPNLTQHSGKVCGHVHEVGFLVIVTEPGVVVNGTYGGDEGVELPPGSSMRLGLWRVTYGKADRVIHFESRVPVIGTRDDIYPIDYRIYEKSCDNEGVWGMACGTTRLEVDCNCYHISQCISLEWTSKPVRDECEDECDDMIVDESSG